MPSAIELKKLESLAMGEKEFKMRECFYRLFKIADGDKTIVFIPALSKVFYVDSKVATALPDFVSTNQPAPKKEMIILPNYLFTNATLLLTNRCNLRCVYCFGDFGGPISRIISMPIQTAYAAIDFILNNAQQLPGRRVRVVMFGGEPTLAWETLVKTTIYLRQKASDVNIQSAATITTNGCFSKERAIWLAKYMDNILLSIDGPKDLHNAHRNGSFARVFDTAKTIYTVAPQKLSFRITVSAFSVDRLPEIAMFLGSNFPGRRQGYEPIFAMGRIGYNQCSMPPAPELFFKKFLEAAKIAKQFKSTTRISVLKLEKREDLTFCGASGNNFMVTYDDRVLACHRMAEIEGVGSLFRYGRFNPHTNTFEFDDAKYQFLKRLTINDIPECRNCFAQHSCRGDCPATKAMLYPADFWKKPSYRCEAIREFTKIALRHILEHSKEGLVL